MVASSSNSQSPPNGNTPRSRATNKTIEKYKGTSGSSKTNKRSNPRLYKLRIEQRLQADATQQSQHSLPDSPSQPHTSSSCQSNAAECEDRADDTIEIEFETAHDSDTFEAGCSHNEDLEAVPFFDTITDTGEADSPLSGTYVASASALETDSSDDDDFEDVVGQDALFNVGDVEHLSESEFASDIASVASNCLGNDTDASSVDDDDFEDVVTGDTVFGVGDAELSAETGGVNDAVFAAAGSSPETTSSISDDDFGDVERFSEPEIADGIPFVAWDDFDSDLEITSINGDDLEDVAARDSTLETGSAEFSSEAGGANIAALVAAGSNDGIPETSSISSDDFDFDLEVSTWATFQDETDNTFAASKYRTALKLCSMSEKRCSAGPLRGVHCGEFGTVRQQSIIAYGLRHLSTWTTGKTPRQANFSSLFAGTLIKKAVPLSQNVIGVVADAGDPDNSGRDGALLLFDINAALTSSLANPSSVVTWPFMLSHCKGVSTIEAVCAQGDRTYFLTGGRDSNKVVLHSYMHEDNAPALPEMLHVKANLKSHVSALGYDWWQNMIASGSIRGQVTVADACTGKFVDQWRLGEDHTSRNAKISNLAFCPTNSNVLMASCGARVNQIRIMDLRDARKPVLSFGVDLFAEYPEEMTPAWNPDNGQVVVPYNHEQTGYDHDYLATFDTRYINANRDSIQALSPYAVGTRAISFGIDQYTNESIMVTADDIGNIGIAHCESTEEYRDEEDRRRGYSESVVNKYTTDSYIVEEWSSDRIHNNTHCRSDYSGEEYSYYDDWGEYD